MGIKLLVVCVLALLMTIPSIFVDSVVEERTQRAKDVIGEISGRAGGQETFLGPTLSIPYTIPPHYKNAAAAHGVYVVFPTKGDASVKLHVEERHRSLFKVPVYQSELKFDASFDLTGVPSSAPVGAELDWSRAGIVIGVSDPRGAQADGTLSINGKTSVFAPSINMEKITSVCLSLISG
jgi:inner membrane protein